MLRIRYAGWLVVFLAFPANLRSQTVEYRDSDTLQPPAQPAPSGGREPDLSRVPKLIVEETNAFRRLKGVHELKVNPHLTKAAQSFAEYLARTDKFSHTADGRQPSERVSAAGYDYCIVAEHIAWEYNSAGFGTRGLAQALVTGWKNSPEHRRNMLDPDVTEIGVGVAPSEKTGRYYGVQDFGRPRSLAITFSVSNETDGVARYTVEGKAFTLPPNTTRTHERCRPADLDFQGVGDTPAPEDARVFHPTTGKHYVIRGGGSRGYQMVEQP
jgi:uncharacterized protein YkwD